MARQSTCIRNNERKAVVLPRKSSRLSTGQTTSWSDHGLGIKGNSSGLQPRPDASKGSKIKETVSVAGLLKNQAKATANARKQKKRKITTPDPSSEPDLAMDFKSMSFVI